MLWEISYANLNMLMATIPTYDSDEDPGKEKENEKAVDGIDEIADLNTFLNL